MINNIGLSSRHFTDFPKAGWNVGNKNYNKSRGSDDKHGGRLIWENLFCFVKRSWSFWKRHESRFMSTWQRLPHRRRTDVHVWPEVLRKAAKRRIHRLKMELHKLLKLTTIQSGNSKVSPWVDHDGDFPVKVSQHVWPLTICERFGQKYRSYCEWDCL